MANEGFLRPGKKRTGIFLMINYLNRKDMYVGVVFKQIILNLFWVVVARAMEHAQYGVNSQHYFILEHNLTLRFDLLIPVHKI